MSTNTVNIGVSFSEIVTAIKRMKKKERESFIENLIAISCPEYLESIREARTDYRAGRIKKHEEIFGRK